MSCMAWLVVLIAVTVNPNTASEVHDDDDDETCDVTLVNSLKEEVHRLKLTVDIYDKLLNRTLNTQEKIAHQDEEIEEMKTQLTAAQETILEQGEVIEEMKIQIAAGFDEEKMIQIIEEFLSAYPINETIHAKLESMDIRNAGTQDMVGFTARMNVGSYYPASSTEHVPFKDALVNLGSHYNTETATFTCPVDGMYFFSVSVYSNWLKYGTERDFSAVEIIHYTRGKNVIVARANSWNRATDDSIGVQPSTSAIVHCSHGDKVWVGPYGISTNQMWGSDTNPLSVFSGCLISAA